MMRIIAIMCEATLGGACEERIHDFVPPIPLACIHAAGPELDSITPEGWMVARWRCVALPEPDRVRHATGGPGPTIAVTPPPIDLGRRDVPAR
jgi:hypothetical protein